MPTWRAAQCAQLGKLLARVPQLRVLGLGIGLGLGLGMGLGLGLG